MRFDQMRRLSFLGVLFILGCCDYTFGQGKIVLIGGGSEDENGWSKAPYQWAVDQSANKKVAVISYATETEFIPEYFKSLGATQADNIRINSRAQAELMYDSLMKYDVFFFKGGDQSFYYKYFKQTKVVDAINDKFDEGGVIAGTSAGMAILSGVIFTAERESVYPDEALSDFNATSITLANDFSQLLPGFIVDSHFTERGRVGRLLAFIANWNFNHDEFLSGIGVDDRTALCIDETNKAFVFGTGSVSFYRTNAMTSFQDEKPVADSVAAIQLLHGHSIQLPELTILNGPDDQINPPNERNIGTYTVLLSGSDPIASNGFFLNEFIQHGSMEDSIVVVTAQSKGTNYISKLQQEQLSFIVVETKASNNSDEQRELRDAIRKSKKVLFVDNDDNTLFNFLEGGKTGLLIREHIRRNNILSGFVGEDSRYAGPVFVTNHLSNAYAAYYGDLIYKTGLNLLSSSVIMSDTYAASTSDYYENTTAAISYAMVKNSLRYGIYLNRGSYLKFDQENLRNYFHGRGDHSTMMLINTGSNTDFASVPVNSAGDIRNYVGFTQMHYALFNGPKRVDAGITTRSQDAPYEYEIILAEEEGVAELVLYPNPTNGLLYYNREFSNVRESELTDVLGNVNRIQTDRPNKCIDLSSFPDGIYFLRVPANRKSQFQKIVIRH
jgi:cyanophycinase